MAIQNLIATTHCRILKAVGSNTQNFPPTPGGFMAPNMWLTEMILTTYHTLFVQLFICF